MKYVLCIILYLSAVLASPVFAEKYALIRDGKIAKYKTIDASDNIAKPKLLAHGYLPVTIGKVPVHDSITQIVTDKYNITESSVTKVYTVKDKTLVAAKTAKKARITMIALEEIKFYFDHAEQNEKVIAVLDKRNLEIALVDSATTVPELRGIDHEFK